MSFSRKAVIFREAQAPQPHHNVHGGTPTLRSQHIIFGQAPGEGVEGRRYRDGAVTLAKNS
jgi:hypothetical protein